MLLQIVCANNKLQLRKWIRANQRAIIRKSSCYLYNDNIYLGVLSHGQLDHLSSVELVTEQDLCVYRWCRSELEDSCDFIYYESQAKVCTNGCNLDIAGQLVVRSFQPLTEMMLIVNLTPDSFSDGGKYGVNLATTLETIEIGLQNGVTIIDIGAESTRPNAGYVSTEEEIKRLIPLLSRLENLKDKYTFKISLDSYKPETVRYFLAKVDIINDVSNKLDISLIKELTDLGKQYVLMHSLTVPANPAINLAHNLDVTAELLEWFNTKIGEYQTNGINVANVILDIGIGFNKTSAQSWQILRNLAKFQDLPCEILIGHSRKSFLGLITSKTASERDLETAIISNVIAQQNIDYIRIHDYQSYLQINNVNNNLGRR